MPKLYEYNLNPKLKKLKSNKFDEYLLENLKKLYEDIKIPIINIKQIKIKSKIFFQISYDKENNGWIVNDNLNNCVIFSEINEIDTLYLDNKITKNMFQICKECYELFRNILKKKESQNNNNINHNFLHEISENTFLGYYLEDKDEIIFYSIVNNLQYNLEQFCLPIKDIEDICFKFGLPYEKSTVLKTDLVTYEQIEQELKYIFRRISEDYCSFQSYGAIVLIEHENEIITGFEILNQEMELLNKMKNIKFNTSFNEMVSKNHTIKEEDENENDNLLNINNNMNLKSSRSVIEEPIVSSDKISIFMKELSLYQLPRCVHIYTKLFHDLAEEDSLNKCLEKLEDISKNVSNLGLCNCIKEKKKISSTSINLLSCLIQKDNLDSYNIERMGNNLIYEEYANNTEEANNRISNNAKSRTFFDGRKTNFLKLTNHPSKMNLAILAPKNAMFTKKIKKRVKFVDEVYNKSLIEEVLIQSYKGYNVKNNYTYREDNNNSKNNKKTSCCLII